jgi:AbiJ N-terminal domain 3/Abortive infection C-terminus
MSTQNKITAITRRNIADELSVGKLNYHGRLDEPDFLSRLFDLKRLPSRDSRYANAYDDIYKHMIMNNDWEADWVFTDTRFNLIHSPDEEYLRFLVETLHPAARMDEAEIIKMQELYNNHLVADGYEIIQVSEISGKPVFEGRQKVIGMSHLIAKKAEIKKYLNTEYVNNKINLMNESVSTDTDLAIGTAKELIETACKSILKKHGSESNPEWNLGKLLKETSEILDFKPKKASDPDNADTSIKQILKGITTMINGVAELRNAYGTGHGKDADFKMLESKYAKLIVGTVSELVVFLLATDGETAEIVE